MRELRDDIPGRLLRALASAPLIPEDEIEAYVRSNGSTELTEPERQILLMVSHGLTQAMVADVLGKSRFTVTDQLKSARYKLKAKNTRHAIALALRAGLIG